MSEPIQPVGETSTPRPVVRRVLEVFVASVAKEEGMTDVADRLRDCLLDKGEYTEEGFRLRAKHDPS